MALKTGFKVEIGLWEGEEIWMSQGLRLSPFKQRKNAANIEWKTLKKWITANGELVWVKSDWEIVDLP